MSAGMIASSYRSVPLRRRPDLITAQLGDEQNSAWAVKDPLALEYHQLEASQYAVLSRLDGSISLHQLEEAINREHPAQALTIEDLQKLVIDLHRKGLVVSDRPGQAETFRDRRWERFRSLVKQAPKKLLFTKLPGWNAYYMLEAMLPWCRWIYHPAILTLASLFVVVSWMLVLVQFAEFRSRLPEFQQFFGWSNLPWLWVTLGFTKIVHEFGHGLTCHYYRRRCHEMGVMVMLFTPTLYCDVTDAWLIREKWPRIWIGAGGMIVETFLAAIATYIWWWTQPGLVNHLALNVVFVCAVTTVLFNANPLMRYDGYYMLADFLGIPNMRQKADRLLDRSLARWVFGHETLADRSLPQHNEFLFVLYAMASTGYGWFVMGSIMMFLYSWLKPYELQSIGVTLLVFSLSGMVISMFWRMWRVSQGQKHGPPRWWRIVLTCSLLIGLLVGLLSIPIPWYVEAAAIIEPAGAVQVMNPVAGRIVAMHVEPGQFVQQGDLLIELENEDLADRQRQLADEIAMQEVTVAAARTADDAAEYSVAYERLAGLKNQLAEANDQLQRLRITAPIAGRVVAAEYRSPPPETSTERLPPWHATPLDPQNIGAFLEPRTSIASIAPGDELKATLYLPQAHRDEVRVGDAVSMKFDAIPGQVFRGELVALSQEHADIVPMPLSNKVGGPLATVTTPDQQEQLQELAYAGEVPLADQSGVLRTGLRGRARFLVSSHTSAWWLLQTARRTFTFRL